MFRRREEENKDSTTTDTNTGSASSASSSSASGSSSAAPLTAAPASGISSASTMMAPSQPLSPARPLEASKPASATTSFRPSAPSAARSAHDRVSPASANQDKTGKNSRRVLTVGHDILLKGEIATCDRLVIEGEVDATLNDVHTVEIAETGSFKGSAKIEDAEISGMFEGELEVRGRLVIYASGKVRGKITYGEIEIERGGELTGEIKMISSSARSETKKNAA